MPSLSFQKDLVPIFHQFRASMMWRLDLTKYEDVKANAAAILANIVPNGGMPPPPFPPLTAEQVALFQQWIAEKFPE
jgi:hypothetical protein